MIKSMTGFGRCEVAEADRKFTVELKSVNHRYLDVNIKMPKKLGFFENNIRTLLKEYIQRGKVDVFILYEDYTGDQFSLKYNAGIAGAYLGHLKEMAQTFGLRDDITVTALSRYPEVFTMEEADIDEEGIWQTLEKALRSACKQLVKSREAEGVQLAEDLEEKLSRMEEHVVFIEKRSPEIITAYKKRLEEKIDELLADRQMDESRIATEVTLFADKICVDEELVRLHSHIRATRQALAANTKESVGRKLDFIAQEMNREANTILSKSSDLTVTDIGIELKTDIEKVREQIQNIE